MGVSKYEKDGKEYWRIRTRLVLPDGRRRQVKKSDIPTAEMAAVLEQKMKVSSFEGRWFDKARECTITVRAGWENYKPITKRDNRAWRDDVARAKFLVAHLGDLRIDSLTIRDIDQYRAKRLREPTPRGTAPAPATLNKEIGLLKRFINYAIRCGDIRWNPISRVPMLKEDNVRQIVIGEQEFEKMLAGASGYFRPVLLLAYDSGMRRQEILKLRWEQVDLKRDVIELGQRHTKTRKPRTIILTARVRETLAALPRSLSGYVFVNPKTDRPWAEIKKMFSRACKAAGVEGAWFHDLRRSFITNARRRGVSESVVMRMSGHKTRAVFERYNVVNEDDLREAMEKIEVGRARELATGTDDAGTR